MHPSLSITCPLPTHLPRLSKTLASFHLNDLVRSVLYATETDQEKYTRGVVEEEMRKVMMEVLQDEEIAGLIRKRTIKNLKHRFVYK